MNKLKWMIIFLNLIVLLVYFHHSVTKKEELLTGGRLLFLELAPTDPRSLMQGDYMTLRYKISEQARSARKLKRGYCVVQSDSSGVAYVLRFQKATTPLKKGEQLIEFTSPNDWNINIGAESFFFQEGEADKYSAAKYGGIRVDSSGNSLLVGLYDQHLIKIE